MEKQHAKEFLKKYLTVIGGPAAVDALDDNDKADKAKEFVKKYFTVVGGAEAIDAAAEPEVKYLTMTLPKGSPTTQISINKNGTPVGTNFQYRVNNGEWTDWDFTSPPTISANAGDVIQWKGVNPNGLSNSDSNYIYFDIPNEVHLSGNVMSLIDGVGKTKVIPCNFCFCFLFQNTKIKTVTKDFLPAKTLAPYCYGMMFGQCTSLTTAPELTATTLTDYCYAVMFYGCTSLATAPALPATTLADNCYSQMFAGCTSLENAPALPATTLAPYCYISMFAGCTSLTTAPALPARILQENCYSGMFAGCSALVNAPELPATTLADNCYNIMFEGCSKLQHVTCLATDISAQNCTGYWLDGVASTGTFVKAAGFNGWSRDVHGIPSNWTVNDYVQPAKESVE